MGNESRDLLPQVEIPRDLFWEGTFFDLMDRVLKYPKIIRTANQRMYDVVTHYGKHTYTMPWEREPIAHFNIFDDPFTDNHRHAIYGIDQHLMDLVGVMRAGAYEFGQQDRIVLLEGPVGTAKSTAGELFASGLEDYSKTEAGQYYATFWVVGEDGDGKVSKDQGAQIFGTVDSSNPYRFDCQMHEQPFRIIPTGPVNIRGQLLQNMNAVLKRKYDGMSSAQLHDFLHVPPGEEAFPHYLNVRSRACPRCNDIFWKLIESYGGDWRKVLENHLRVKRALMSRDRRIGIAITRPKSEKDQDATEWSGDTNYVALGKFGSTADPRTFDFRGYFEVAEGGMLYSEELLKLSQTFLYDYLGASQEHRIQPRGLNEVDIDVFIMGGTNEPEYQKLKDTKEMEALRDRIVKVTIPYIGSYLDETKIYRKSFHEGSRFGRHLAPFTLETASFWAVMTRLKPDDKISLRNKAKLYAGRHVEGYKEDSVREFKRQAEHECREGASPRFISDRISEAFMQTFTRHGGGEYTDCVTPFVVLREIRNGLPEHQHITSKSQRESWEKLVEETEAELNSWLTAMIQEIIVGDTEALRELHQKYIDNLMALKDNRRVWDDTRGEVDPDANFLKAIEAEAKKTDDASREQFRTKIINAIARRATELTRDAASKPFQYNSDEVLFQAYKDYLFKQEQKNIDWQALVSKKVVGDQASQRLAAIRDGLMKKGCCKTCAGAFITHVAGIFIRGQQK